MAAVRTIIAAFIALSLTFAPFSAVRAMKAAHAGEDLIAAEMDMPDCHKPAKHEPLDGCDCCKDHSKSNCPDAGACLLKCGAQIAAILVPGSAVRLGHVSHDRPANLAKPPGLPPVPPGPPPRV